jgi:Cu(I)/Ag(I) efflux system membrane fusion protein
MLTTATIFILSLLLSQPSISQEIVEYTCPMHPHYISTDADGICPVCGMGLVAARLSQATLSAPEDIQVSEGMLQTMGVRVAEVKKTALSRKIRAFGNVQANTRREVVSASRLEGWIENLAVTAEGDTVARGQLLYQIYSPELVAAQKDFLASLNIGNKNRINATGQRLRSLGMQRTAIASLREKRELLERIPVYAEDSGIVQSLEARDGAYVKPGNIVLKLQSYIDVWVIASIVEQDINDVVSGIPVRLNFPSAPSAPATGIVDYVYPTIDPVTRTLKVRIVVKNEQGVLRPGAFADVAFEVERGESLTIPSEAVLYDSLGSHVIISLGEGKFRSRKIQIGNTTEGKSEITAGLNESERVVVSGQFMLDSEANLREGFAKLAPSTSLLNIPLSELSLDTNDIALIDHFVETAIYFHEALIDQYDIDPHYLSSTITAGEILSKKFPNTRLQTEIVKMQQVLIDVQNTDDGNSLASQLALLTQALSPWLLQEMPTHYHALGIRLYQDVESGHYFIQQGDSPSNPYGPGAVRNIILPAKSPC